MSFADFSKSSGPSGPPRNQMMFGNAPAFPWKPPISYPEGLIVPVQNVVQQQEQQLFPSPERSGGHTEIYSRDKVNESPKLTESMALNSESNSTVQNPNFSSKVSVRLEVSHNKPEQRISPPRFFASSQRLDRLKSHSDAQTTGSFSLPKLAYGGAPKRSRSPVVSMEEPFHSSSVLLESDREIHAKAKRLARFNMELAHPIQNLNDISRHQLSGSRQNQFGVNPSKTDERTEEAQGVVFGGSFSDLEGAKSMKVVGLCPDMCPESEREERERKGDLDKYERLDGDRNQTSKYLAVKKYNRTAEREAELIRPLPVLQRTVAYLLNLLDRPYDGSFLNIYNFLWDRMRAIRMDLRMQHIFNADAIAMLEQMIRIHIIAMHELCEFEKGEGFTEGFDAHLNIEQMNKTSVELFQMYDDHRKKGKSFLSEKEFRGYYALLKLDKHPGYKVEPAELSLDLAKMTPEIRCTREILFARDVARACRIGNYIAFFRLARKATYLQACLMHAHFSKLLKGFMISIYMSKGLHLVAVKMRKQALASLHSGLQHNRGIPVVHVEKWLALEGEDVVGLLDFYGLSIKRYEEAYLVKESPLLNSDMEFPTRCAHLVQSKRSSKIVDDVRTVVALEELPVASECREDVVDIVDQRKPIDTEMQLNVFDELLDSQVIHSPINLTGPKLFEERPAFSLNKERRVKMPIMPAMKAAIASPVEDVGEYTDQDEDQEMLLGDRETLFNGVTFQTDENNKVQPVNQSSTCMIFDLATKVPESEHLKKEVLLPSFNEEETTMEKLRQILRTWKKHSALRRESREQQEFLANTALSSLSLGPPVRQMQSQQAWSNGGLDIDAISIARFGKYGDSWSRLNISDVVTPIMAARNPFASFICWKLVLLVQLNDPDAQPDQLASNWLFSKLFCSTNRYDADLVLSSSDLSIWKKWIDSQFGSPKCGLSIVRKIVVEDSLQTVEEDALHGASCLMYLISETMPWEVQRARLQNLLVSIPPGSELPLLVLSPHLTKGEHAKESIEIVNRLALREADKTRINSFSVIFLADSKRLDYVNGFFDEHQLRIGLQWLATNSPSQPLLHLVRTRELVFGHLRHCMEAAEKLKGSVAEPDHYVAAFNKVLDKSAEEIRVTASASPTFWPPPEINLLDQSSIDGIMVRHCLPSLGWSSPSRIIPVVRAIESCKLPGFPDLSWLNHGSLAGDQVKQQKLALEESLIIYLNESCKLLKADLAAWEARVMLQHGAGLELRESGYFIVPRWNLIFQRIYCWQLNKLISQDVSKSYVLANKDSFIAMDATGNPEAASQLVSSGFKEHPSNSCFEDLPWYSLHSEVSLDELIEMCCVDPCEKYSLGSIPTTLGVGDDAGGNADVSISNQPDKHPLYSDSHEISDLLEANANMVVPLPPKNDRLTTLLERCHILQDRIDQKLAIYF